MLLVLLLFFCVPLMAQEDTALIETPDSARAVNASVMDASQSVCSKLMGQIKSPIAPQPITLRSMAVPAVLLSYGAISLTSDGVKAFNRSIRDELSAHSSGKEICFDSYAKYLPAAAVYGLNIAGVKGRHNLVDRNMLYGFSNLIGGGITASAKRITGVLRPDSSDRYSFPSGHATGAFIAAEFLRQEYKHRSPWYGVAGYAVAAGTGFLRMYNNKHWFSDVVAGAGVGILSTRIAYWLYPVVKNAVFKNKSIQTVIAPSYGQGAWGFTVVSNF